MKNIKYNSNNKIKDRSCFRKFKVANEDGYDNLFPIENSLGFNDAYELQNKLNSVRHLINADDVVTVCNWLYENDYDIINFNK